MAVEQWILEGRPEGESQRNAPLPGDSGLTAIGRRSSIADRTTLSPASGHFNGRVMKNICVYCGSASGTNPEYAEAARRVGMILAERGLGLVYGGGQVGLMGIVADAVLNAGGQVVGVIPEPLATREVAHDGLTELIVVADMHERKAMMARRSDAFLTLPGGIGTYEEFFETLSWAMLRLHHKPMGVLDVAGYFEPLQAMLDHAVSERFLRAEVLDLLVVSTDPAAIIDEMARRTPARRPAQRVDFD